MLSEGRVLADRYEITGKIGTGGMSDVYKAKDHKLNRYVAIKVLKSEFSENRNFVSKFRVEAQSAAILMHPNIVNVYDVGDEDNLHYIVMELVEGITLKKYIEKKIRLSVKETVSIAIQVSMGIEAAHNNHIIHRDIKPQNIIVSKEGKVKVTDFGIARAATSNTITSNAMGSVHYTSPEQARGGYSDEKSDIYSLGITMFEMLTGRVPYDGETTVSIAIKHIQEELPSPRLYVEDVPISVEQIILKCCQKNAARRYQTMTDLIVDLKKSLISPDEDFVEIVDTQGAKTRMMSQDDIKNIRLQTGSIGNIEEDLAWNTGRPSKVRSQKPQRPLEEEDYVPEYVPKASRSKAQEVDYGYMEPEYDDPYDKAYDDLYGEDEEPEELRVRSSEKSRGGSGKPRKKSSDTKSRSQKKNTSSKSKNSSRTSSKSNKKAEQKSASAAANKARKRNKDFGYEEDEDEDDIDPKMEKIMSVLSIIAALIIAAIAIFIVAKVFGIFKSTTGTLSSNSIETSVVSMPDVTGMNFDVAKNELQSLGIKVQATYTSSSTVDKDQVIDQNIPEGERLSQGDVVELTVSSGTDGLAIPDVTGKSEAEARVTLENAGFSMVKDESASDSVEKGNVISQNPASGELATEGATVTVIISTGKSTNQVTVPDIRLQTEADAKSMLTAAGLNYSAVEEAFSDTVPIGCVVAQSYSPNVSVPEGTSVGYTLSKGPEAAVPATYKCNFSVNAPGSYSGGNAAVTLTQPDTGAVLFSTVTTSFPVAINLTNITGSDQAVISITYNVNNTTVIENEDGSPNSIVTTEEKTDYQQVTLTPQD